MTVETDALPDDTGTLKAMLIAERVRNERLLQIIKELQRHRFGRRAETLPEDQMLLAPSLPQILPNIPEISLALIPCKTSTTVPR